MTLPRMRFRDTLKALHLAPALALGLTGCGADPVPQALYPVKGKVLLADDRPLKGGRVVFLPSSPNGLPASGEIGDDGSFTLRSPAGTEGAPAGNYKVSIQPARTSVDAKTGRLDLKRLPFPTTYLDLDGDTGLTATVKAESTTLPPFKLVAPAAPRARERG